MREHENNFYERTLSMSPFDQYLPYSKTLSVRDHFLYENTFCTRTHFISTAADTGICRIQIPVSAAFTPFTVSDKGLVFRDDVTRGSFLRDRALVYLHCGLCFLGPLSYMHCVICFLGSLMSAAAAVTQLLPCNM